MIRPPIVYLRTSGLMSFFLCFYVFLGILEPFATAFQYRQLMLYLTHVGQIKKKGL